MPRRSSSTRSLSQSAPPPGLARRLTLAPEPVTFWCHGRHRTMPEAAGRYRGTRAPRSANPACFAPPGRAGSADNAGFDSRRLHHFASRKRLDPASRCHFGDTALSGGAGAARAALLLAEHGPALAPQAIERVVAHRDEPVRLRLGDEVGVVRQDGQILAVEGAVDLRVLPEDLPEVDAHTDG